MVLHKHHLIDSFIIMATAQANGVRPCSASPSTGPTKEGRNKGKAASDNFTDKIASLFERLYFFLSTGIEDPALKNPVIRSWKNTVLMAVKHFRKVSPSPTKYFLFLYDVSTGEQGYIPNNLRLDGIDESCLDEDMRTEIECNLVVHETEPEGDAERIGFLLCRLDRFAVIAIRDSHVLFPSVADPCWDVDSFISRYDAVIVVGGKVEVKRRNHFIVRVWKLNNESLSFSCQKCSTEYKSLYNCNRCAATCRLKIKEPSVSETWDVLDIASRSVVVELVQKSEAWTILNRLLKYPLRRVDADAQVLATSMLQIDAHISSRGIASMVDRGREGTTSTGDHWSTVVGVYPALDENALFNATASLAHEMYMNAHDAYVQTKHIAAQEIADALLLEEEDLKRKVESKKEKKALRKKKRQVLKGSRATKVETVEVVVVEKDEEEDENEEENEEEEEKEEEKEDIVTDNSSTAAACALLQLLDNNGEEWKQQSKKKGDALLQLLEDHRDVDRARKQSRRRRNRKKRSKKTVMKIPPTSSITSSDDAAIGLNPLAEEFRHITVAFQEEGQQQQEEEQCYYYYEEDPYEEGPYEEDQCHPEEYGGGISDPYMHGQYPDDGAYYPHYDPSFYAYTPPCFDFSMYYHQQF